VLAYVFWHVAAAEVDAAEYEERLAGFHAALRVDRPPGLGLTATVGLDAIPWLGGAAGYEDWYLVDDFAALGVLNAAAVSGSRKGPHDAAAGAARHGVAGVMGHVAGPLLPERPGWAAWLAKPAGMGYDAFHAELWEALGNDASAWQRQMVLGPATEYCVLAPAAHALPWRAQAWPVRDVVTPAG
jgi:hypothetical protein